MSWVAGRLIWACHFSRFLNPSQGQALLQSWVSITQYHSGARATHLSRASLSICTSTQKRWVLNSDATGSCFCWDISGSKGMSPKTHLYEEWASGAFSHNSCSPHWGDTLEVLTPLHVKFTSNLCFHTHGLTSVASERTLRQKAQRHVGHLRWTLSAWVQARLELPKAFSAEIRGEPRGCDSEQKFVWEISCFVLFPKVSDPPLRLSVFVSSFREKREELICQVSYPMSWRLTPCSITIPIHPVCSCLGTEQGGPSCAYTKIRKPGGRSWGVSTNILQHAVCVNVKSTAGTRDRWDWRIWCGVCNRYVLCTS